jgi:putative transposase
MTAPVVAVGDGALGGGNAVGEGWPETRAPRGWVPRRAPGRDTWPKRRPPNATHAVPERINAAPRGDAEAAITAVTAAYQAQEPNAGACLDRDQEKRLRGGDVPAAPWLHWRTTTPVASPCRTVRCRQRVTTGAGSRTQGLVRAYTRLVRADGRWRTRNAPHLRPLVHAKVPCVEGIQQRRPEDEGVKEAA